MTKRFAALLLFALAIPSALSYVLMASETGIVNGLLKGVEHGKEALAAYAIYYRVFQFVVMPAIAASVAMLPFAARRFGESGRPDLAGSSLAGVRAPTLFIVGGEDTQVLALNEEARRFVAADTRLEVIPGATHLFEEPGAMDQVAALAGDWLKAWLR